MTLRPRLAAGLPFFTVTSGLWELSVRRCQNLDRTCVHGLAVKIQVVQLRRVLLLFALVLGLSAVVASLAPPPEPEKAAPKEQTGTPTVGAQDAIETESVTFKAPDPDDRAFKTPTRLVPSGSSLSVEVSVPEPGDIALDGLGLRQSADPLSPARFQLLAKPIGRYSVLFLPTGGDPRLVGRIEFAP